MTAPKYNIGMQNIPPKTLVGNMLDYWAPPVPLDNDDLASSSKIEIITADKVLSANDSGKIFRVDANTAYNITIANTLPEGFNASFAQWGNAAITFVSANGAVNRSTANATSAQYKLASVVVIKNTANNAEYLVGQV